jgi:hypothetical protein
MTSFIQPLTYSTRSSKQQNSRHTIKDITYTILNNTENLITLTSIKTRGEIRCPIANTRVNHSKKAKLNIMHVTVNFLGLFFRTGKIFFGLTRFSCLSVRMTDNFLASFGKSSLLKKMKESCKLDINQSVPENILSRPEVKRKQCGGDL